MVATGKMIRAKKAQELQERFAHIIVPGETMRAIVKLDNIMPMLDYLLITDLRSIGFGQEYTPKVEVAHNNAADISTRNSMGSKALVITAPDGKKSVFKFAWNADAALIEDVLADLQRTPPDATAAQQLAATGPSAESKEGRNERIEAMMTHAVIIGSKPWPAARKRLLELCHSGEVGPWLILSSFGFSGLLAAFDDRLVILKTGALTGLMAGALGGERSATFHYQDITGIEYNSGILAGVLEILTPSYEGTRNKDFWQGTLHHRNADANDPFTLSNTLPLNKSEYRAAVPYIDQLRKRISDAKRTVVVANLPEPSPTGSLTEELKKLADLHGAGVLNDQEFAEAKQRLIAGQ